MSVCGRLWVGSRGRSRQCWWREVERSSTCELDTDRDSISLTESPWWNCMMSASNCLVLQEEEVEGER